MADGSILDAVKITYDGKVGVANATGGVAISSPPRDLTASADTAVYETNNSGYIELIGNAKATQDGNTVEGNRLRLNNTSNKAEASGNLAEFLYRELFYCYPTSRINLFVANEPCVPGFLWQNG